MAVKLLDELLASDEPSIRWMIRTRVLASLAELGYPPGDPSLEPECTAGLVPTSPGYRTFAVRPRRGGGLTRVVQRLESPGGVIGIEWRADDARFELTVDVPEPSSAEIELPSGRTTQVGAGRHVLVS